MVEITEHDFSIDDLMKRAKSAGVGAVVTFTGTVRDDGIQGMKLEAYDEVALPELVKIRDEAVEKFGLSFAEVIHRTGSLSVGDNIVLIVCSASHRKEAFEGCRYIIEELKVRVPIWKKELKTDGDKWVGM
ncbi:MAG TPA: molybdenum cofactor biosynthesis protein MoaE [Methanotrichaceae archaeon]|nr:molybdenum cofactor biosynthesis protein MoaE [Methanotrichaceae archaeon]